MTVGRPGPGLESVRWVRERLFGLGLSEDHLVLSPSRLTARLAPPDLELTSYLPEFGPLVQRLQRLLGGGRALSIFITGNRGEEQARAHAALQIALGSAPTGRQVVIVDADFLRPGLGGLIAESSSEGVIDMVRFGRSTRSLLQRPNPEGPWLLPAGSFPVDDPAPLAPDALRSVVYRVSQACDLALYVGPLPIRNELHPLARVCDHIVYVMQDDGADAAAGLLESVDQLQQQNAHLAGVVLYVAPEPATYAERQMPRPALPSDPVLPASPARYDVPSTPLPAPSPSAGGFAPPPLPPDDSPFALPPLPTSWPERPAATESTRSLPPLGAKPSPDWTEQERTPPAIDWNRIGAPDEEFGAPATAGRDPEAPLELPPFDLPRGPTTRRADFEAESNAESGAFTERSRRDLAESVARRRPRDEARDVGRDLDLRNGDFAFEQESRGSRWPLLLMSLMVVVAIGFVSWTLWGRRMESKKLLESSQQSQPPGEQSPAATGETTSPSQSSAPPKGPESVPKEAPQPATTTPPPGASSREPDDRAAAQTDVGKPPVTPATTPGTTPVTPPGTTPATRGATEPARPEPASPEQVPPRPEPVAPRPSPPVTSPANPEPAAGAAAGDYAVHVASYKKQSQAQKEIDQLRKYGYESRAIQTDLGSKGVWFRVFVGSCSTSAEANALRDKLLQLPGYDFAQVRRLPRD